MKGICLRCTSKRHTDNEFACNHSIPRAGDWPQSRFPDVPETPEQVSMDVPETSKASTGEPESPKQASTGVPQTPSRSETETLLVAQTAKLHVGFSGTMNNFDTFWKGTLGSVFLNSSPILTKHVFPEKRLLVCDSTTLPEQGN